MILISTFLWGTSLRNKKGQKYSLLLIKRNLDTLKNPKIAFN